MGDFEYLSVDCLKVKGDMSNIYTYFERVNTDDNTIILTRCDEHTTTISKMTITGKKADFKNCLGDLHLRVEYETGEVDTLEDTGEQKVILKLLDKLNSNLPV